MAGMKVTDNFRRHPKSSSAARPAGASPRQTGSYWRRHRDGPARNQEHFFFAPATSTSSFDGVNREGGCEGFHSPPRLLESRPDVGGPGNLRFLAAHRFVAGQVH
jgi:hypothetical protein